ncbi:major facilitator superfamily domain-containing protein [Phascolomyces articulosus]|uniref:Major facilitator superfamily domain-containing protein n=1 Tax=Phascolomyces articulosus TaxID=60185 RepID=A0AAD5PCR2_9FUNG|nr:major facilitator superfamily domain-containing protein [Phascolomyces articulosus]
MPLSLRSIDQTTVSADALSVNGKVQNEVQQQSTVNKSSEQPKRTLLQTLKLVLLVIGILLAMFMVSLNSTVVAPAMSIIATELDALEKQTWIATSYMVAMNAFQPLSGKFSDIFGRKPILLFGMCIFFVGSLVNALTPTIEGLIAGRTLQGFGAGGIMSMLFVIITDIAPLEWRPRLQSMLVVVYGLASVVGPLIGGAFVDYLSWRWDFWLNIILCGSAIVIVFFLFKETSEVRQESMKEKIMRIDFLGTVFSIGLVVCLLLALSWGPQKGWGSAHCIGPFVAAGVSLILLIISEGWIAKEPIMPYQVLLNPRIAVIYLYMVTLGLGFIGTLYFGPILFQAVFGANSSESGIRLIPYMVCLIAGSVGSGILLSKFPYVKLYIIIGSASNILGYGLFYTVDETANWGRQAGFLTFCGFAFGLSQQNCILGVQSVAGKEFMAVATSLNNFFMLLASSIGIAIYQTLFSTFLQAQFSGLDPQVLAVANEYGALKNYLYIREVPAEYQGPVIHAYMQALNNVFIVPIVAGGLGVIAACCVRNIRYGAPPQAKGDAKDVEAPVETAEEKIELQQAQSINSNNN